MNLDVCELQYWIEQTAERDAPFSAPDYQEVGVPESSAKAWREAGIPPQIAADFEAMDVGSKEAVEWGVIPPVAAEFRAMGFDAQWTRAWRSAVGFTGAEAAAWRDAGLSIADAQVMCSADRVATALLLQAALAGVAPATALRSILLDGAAGRRT